jgi:hypothetical protein
LKPSWSLYFFIPTLAQKVNKNELLPNKQFLSKGDDFSSRTADYQVPSLIKIAGMHLVQGEGYCTF